MMITTVDHYYDLHCHIIVRYWQMIVIIFVKDDYDPHLES